MEKTYEDFLLLSGYSKKTAHTFIKYAVRFMQWLKKENMIAEQVRQNDMMSFIEGFKLAGSSNRTLAITVNAVKHYFEYLTDQQIIEVNPCSNIRIKGIKRKMLYDVFTGKELNDIYHSFTAATPAEKRNKVILSLIITRAYDQKSLESCNCSTLN